MASQIRIFDSNFTDGGETTFLYYNRTRSANDAPYTKQYFNINNVIHDNLLGMNSVEDSSGTFTNGNRYYSRTKADLSNFNNSLIEASKTTSGDSFLEYISLVGNEGDSEVLVNSVDQTGYPIYYPIPIEFVGFNGISSNHNSYNANYASGFKTVKYYTNTPSSRNYHINFDNKTYNYSSSDAWRNGQITLSAGSNYLYYLCASLTLKQNYYVWNESDSVSFDVVLYVFTNLANTTTGFPWANKSIRNNGIDVPNHTGWKYEEYPIESYTLSSGGSCTIKASDIKNKLNSNTPKLLSDVNVYFGHGEKNESTNRFDFKPDNWGYFINDGIGGLVNFISTIACTTSNYSLSRKGVNFACPDFRTPETGHFCNIPVVIQGTKRQENGTSSSNPVFYSIGFIGLKNVKYNISTSVSSNWINPFPNDAITYYKYLCLEEYNPSEYTGMNAVSSANSYFMINNKQTVYVVNSYSNAYVQSYNAQVTSNFITLSYSYIY